MDVDGGDVLFRSARAAGTAGCNGSDRRRVLGSQATRNGGAGPLMSANFAGRRVVGRVATSRDRRTVDSEREDSNHETLRFCAPAGGHAPGPDRRPSRSRSVLRNGPVPVLPVGFLQALRRLRLRPVLLQPVLQDRQGNGLVHGGVYGAVHRVRHVHRARAGVLQPHGV
jgi:hypothetical protein